MRSTIKTVNRNFCEAKYAVRGGIPLLAEQISEQIQKYPFDSLVFCNIGNPQKLEQKPITFYREVLSLCICPSLVEEHPNLFSKESVKRAKELLSATQGGRLGAYTDPQGIRLIREQVANFVERRDKLSPGSVNPDDIFLTDGASPGVKLSLQALIDADDPKSTGFMIPIPQYPLYSATITSLGASTIPYYLEEETCWSVNTSELEEIYKTSMAKGIIPKAICVINPGNPCGAVLTEECILSIIDFSITHDLVILADEVYQENIYCSTKKFISFQKASVTYAKRHPEGGRPQIISFHSASKGYIGECGARGGYFVLSGFGSSKGVRSLFRSISSQTACPNTAGQILISTMVNPPSPGSDAYDKFMKEKNDILCSLNERGKLSTEAFNRPGMSCQPVEGAMYSFPSITLPPAFVVEAKSNGLVPDFYYCKLLVEQTGIVVVPGSGFLQKDGTWHFRCSILPPLRLFKDFLKNLVTFHDGIMTKYGLKEEQGISIPSKRPGQDMQSSTKREAEE